MIGNSQGEAEIPLDCYLSWMSPKDPGVNHCNIWARNVIMQSTPHNILSGFDPTGAPPQVLYRNVVVYSDGSIHSPGGPQ
jgi:hypothetical protein